MATKLITPRKNNFNVTGLIVKNDAFINSAKTVAHFRIAACGQKDAPSAFFDCVMFARENVSIPEAVLKKGTKVEIEGYFHMNQAPAKDDKPAPDPKLELVVRTIKENTPVEVEVKDGDAEKLPAQKDLIVEAAADMIDPDPDFGDIDPDLGL